MRQIIPINNDWLFSEDFRPEYTKNKDFPQFQKVRIPHTVKETPLHYFDEHIYQMESCYQKIIPYDAGWAGKRIYLAFDGVGHDSTVYVNGAEIGSHHCGYTGFRFEITEALTEGDNLITVRVDSGENLNVPPFGYVIDYMTYGGIYREVRLEILEEVYVEDVFLKCQKNDSAWSVDTEVTLDGKDTFDGMVTFSMAPKETDEWVELGSVQVNAGQKQFNFAKELSETGQFIREWDIDAPNLYRWKTILKDHEGKILDEKTDVFGFRTMEFRLDGFFLNGRRVRIRGLNRHQSYPYVGYAMPRSMQELDADILKKELGVNAVRTSHYPQSQFFLNRCDEIGLLVFTEMPGWQHIGDEAWKKQAIENTRDMILQYRNHPSIMLWGVRINESVDDDTFYERTNQLAHELDPTRCTGGVRAIKNSNLLEDVYTYNDFVHEGDNRGCEPKNKVTSNMQKPYLVSEYNGHMFPTKAYDCEDHRVSHALRHSKVLDDIAGYEDIAGSFGWCMFDYNTHKDFGSGDRICYHGVMDMFRNPKLAAAVYASQQEETPVLTVSSSMDIGEHPGCNRGQIYLFTNADSVKMYKNGRFLKEYKREDSPYKNLSHGPLVVDDFVGDVLETEEHMPPAQAKKVKELLNAVAKYGLNKLPLSAKWNGASLILGYHMNFDQATVLYNKYVGDWGGTSTAYRFEAIKDGKVVKTVTKEPMTKMQLEAVADHTTLREEDTYDVALIRLQAQDEFGNLLSFYNDPVEIETMGALEQIGPRVVALQGGMLGFYVKSCGYTGDGMVRIRAQGMEEKIIKFRVERR